MRETTKDLLSVFESSDAFLGHRQDEPIEIGELRRVQYVRQRPVLSVDVIKNPDAVTADFLFSKSHDWAYEQEWRIIRFLTNANKVSQGNIYLFEVPPTAIRQVIFGFKADDSLKKTLLAAAKNPQLAHVEFRKADLSRNEFDMDILTLDAPEPFNLALAWLRARNQSKTCQ